MAQPKPVLNERQKYVNKLKEDLKKISAAQDFEKTPSGELVIQILEADVNMFANDVASDKYIDNHMGYVDTRAKLSYATSLLGRLKSLDNPAKEKEIRERLDEAQSEPGA